VVGVEPVVARPQEEPGRGEHRFVPGAADLEVDAVLALELDFLVVDAARQVHGAVNPDEALARQPQVAEVLGPFGNPFGRLRAHRPHAPYDTRLRLRGTACSA